MDHRFYVETPITTERVTLTGAEAHHLLHVLRAKCGTEVILFDGSGGEFRSRIISITRKSVELTIESRAQVNRELPIRLILGVALPKAARQRWMVEKAVELGVTRMVLLNTQNCSVRTDEHGLHRLSRAVVEASKQCGRNQLMEITEPLRWTEYIEELAQRITSHGCAGYVAHPGRMGHRQISVKSSPQGAGPSQDVYLAVGPEGGLTPEEVDLAVRSGWHIVGLGPRTLRVETAAVVLSAVAGLQI